MLYIIDAVAETVRADWRPIHRVLRTAHYIIRDEFHPDYNLFKLMRSGNRYRSIPTRCDRALESFYPTAIRTLNECH